MDSSPKLKIVMDEIKAILDKYDTPGVVVVHTQDKGQYFAETLMQLTCSKSAVIIRDNGIRIKAKKEEKERMEYTASMFSMLGLCTGEKSLILMDISQALDKTTGATHGVAKFTPHITPDQPK